MIIINCCLLLELPVLLPINKLVEALLRVNNGSYLICCLLANVPESYSRGELLPCSSIHVLSAMVGSFDCELCVFQKLENRKNIWYFQSHVTTKRNL